MTSDSVDERRFDRIPGRLLAIVGAMVAALAVFAYLDLNGTLLAGRFVVSAILAALMVYQTILAVLGYRARTVGPRTEQRIWLENASVIVVLMVLATAVWLV